MTATLIGYARCSTDKQGLTANRDRLLELGVVDDRIYLDHGLTGTNRDRPGLDQALAAIRSGDTLVVPKLDRSAPDARDIGDTLVARGIRLSINGTIYDPTDPMGKMFFNILATFAEFEVDLLRMRTREGMTVARAQGKLRGKQPKLSTKQQAHLVQLHGAGDHSIPASPSCSASPAPPCTDAVVADTTDEQALRQLGVHQLSHAVVGIGTELEASIVTTSLLVDLGVPNIWAKAVSRRHGQILERVGAHHVVLPEHEMGERVAHLVTGRMLDFIEFEDDYALVKTRAPAEAIDKTFADSALRAKYGVTVVSLKRPREDFTYATADTMIYAGDILIVAGKTDAVEAFANVS